MRGDHDTGTGAATAGSLCAFWLEQRCLGLDVALVGEVVAIQRATAVPMAHDAVRGIFNLRGAPIVVLELGAILGLGIGDAAGDVGLVLRIGDLVAAARIDRVEAIIPAGRGLFLPRDPAGDHPAVLGFLDDRKLSGRVVTVLDPVVLIERLEALRYIVDSSD